MTWIGDTRKTLNYIESHLAEDITIAGVAKHVCASESHLQRIFGIVTGFTLAEYIRLRRLSVAGQELSGGGRKVLDTALKYGYECVKMEPTILYKYFQKPLAIDAMSTDIVNM